MVLGPWSFGFLGLSRFPGFGVSGPLDLWVSGSLFLGFWVSDSLGLWVFRFQGLCNTHCQQLTFKNCKNCNNEAFLIFRYVIKVWKNLLEGEQVM